MKNKQVICMQRSKKWLLRIFILALVIFVLARLYYALTDDFRLSNITQVLPYQAEWVIPTPSPSVEQHVDQILLQPFTYLSKGSQSYVFESEDGAYVLKFFKFKHLRPSWFFETASSLGLFKNYHTKLAARKERKLWGVFRAYKLAYDVDKEESGLIFIQLNTEGNPARSVKVKDKIGIVRTIDLEHLAFILQERGETLRAVLEALLQKKDINTALQRIAQILDLYASEYSKGIYDHDHGVLRNVGFAGDRPIHLDVGKLMIEGSMRQKNHAREDINLVTAQINHWFKRHYPQYAAQAAAYMDKKTHQLFGP